jgi:DNA invertase Pin-like site-specific DNA recombinase
VSAVDQNEARQIAAIGEVDRLFVDKASGKTTDRGGLQAMLRYVRDGDTIRVKSPDRLARSTTDLLALVEQLAHDGIGVEFVDNPGLNTDSPHGEFMLTILAAVAQLERAMIRERQAEGIALAKARGVYVRRPKLSAQQVHDARARIDGLGVPLAPIDRDFSTLGLVTVSRTTGLGGKIRRGTWSWDSGETSAPCELVASITMPLLAAMGNRPVPIGP